MQLGKKEIRNSLGNIYVTVFYDTQFSATVDVWTGPFENEAKMKAGLMLVLENIAEFKAKKWLADLTCIEGNFEAVKEFIAMTVIPKAVALGLKREAVVLPNNIFSLLAVQETMQIIENFQIRIFGSVDDAVAWLNA